MSFHHIFCYYLCATLLMLIIHVLSINLETTLILKYIKKYLFVYLSYTHTKWSFKSNDPSYISKYIHHRITFHVCVCMFVVKEKVIAWNEPQTNIFRYIIGFFVVVKLIIIVSHISWLSVRVFISKYYLCFFLVFYTKHIAYLSMRLVVVY